MIFPKCVFTNLSAAPIIQKPEASTIPILSMSERAIPCREEFVLTWGVHIDFHVILTPTMPGWGLMMTCPIFRVAEILFRKTFPSAGSFSTPRHSLVESASLSFSRDFFRHILVDASPPAEFSPFAMGAPRRKNLIARRRTDDDADEEPAPLDDSSSISPTDVEDDADGEGSGSEGGKNDGKPAPEKKQTGLAMPAAMADTDAMMNGLQILGKDDTATISFEDAGTESSPAEHRKKEHDEYKRRRDDDPAFVPNRGGFFMHDQRHANGVLLGRGRGRGRPFPAQYVVLKLLRITLTI